MSPSKFQDLDHHHMTTSKNGVYRSVKKESHSIQKPPNSQSTTKRPVIIYTHAPKVIETTTKEFMALVQRLTGMSQDEKPPVAMETERESREDNEYKNLQQQVLGYEENESSTGMDDQYKFVGEYGLYNPYNDNNMYSDGLPPLPDCEFTSWFQFQNTKMENYSCPVSPMKHLDINADYQSNNFADEYFEYQNHNFP